MILKQLLKNNKPQPQPLPSPPLKSPALRIIHAGGHVEAYYMAVPASRILESHPAAVLARPDVFRRPWDAVVYPEEILRPGEKFFLVPRRSLKKLRRQVRRPLAEFAGGGSILRIREECKERDLNKGKKRVTWQPSLTSILET